MQNGFILNRTISNLTFLCKTLELSVAYVLFQLLLTYVIHIAKISSHPRIKNWEILHEIIKFGFKYYKYLTQIEIFLFK